ncbi:MAG TPA: hypothetical protein VJI97_04310 [Candidatus Nanoarchaeia archaeon]|nr:hypothetical protein [Candidatus Nanoarchaeia archaeon]
MLQNIDSKVAGSGFWIGKGAAKAEYALKSYLPNEQYRTKTAYQNQPYWIQ